MWCHVDETFVDGGDTMSDKETAAFQDFNRQLIGEFRENKGQVGGMFAGAPLLILTTTGAKHENHEGREENVPLRNLCVLRGYRNRSNDGPQLEVDGRGPGDLYSVSQR